MPNVPARAPHDRNIGAAVEKGPARVVPPRAARLCAALAATALLAGCSDGPDLFGETVENPGICPDVSVLADAAEVFEMGGPAAPENVTVHGVIGDFQGGCDYSENAVEVSLSLVVGGERGPALSGDSATTDYFVAVVDPDGQILNKRIFDVTFDFSEGARTASEQQLYQRIPLPNGPFSGPNYQVLLGFQLSEAELAYNRSLAGQ
jgi:hypothetical protein